MQSNLILAGWRNDVPQLLAAADFYVHPSRWEGLPLALLEAMAAARPTICTDGFKLPTGYLPGVHGLVARADDSQSLAAALEKVCALSSEERATMGQAARALVQAQFNIAESGRRFATVVEQTLADG